jgi:hypothetical protein
MPDSGSTTISMVATVNIGLTVPRHVRSSRELLIRRTGGGSPSIRMAGFA